MKNNAEEKRKINVQTHSKVKYYAGTPGEDLGDEKWDKELEPDQGLFLLNKNCRVTNHR